MQSLDVYAETKCKRRSPQKCVGYTHFLTCKGRSAARWPASGPESNMARRLSLALAFDGTLTEAEQNVPHANPDAAVERTVPSLSVRTVCP